MSLSYPYSNNKTPSPSRVLYSEEDSIPRLANLLHEHLYLLPQSREIVVLCVGTDRSTGDSLGPLIGSKLNHFKNENLTVYGTLDEPVHAVNLEETIQKINLVHNTPYIIAVDACLGQLTSVGYVQVGIGPLKPGAGVNKSLPPVGDMHVTGIVNVGGFMEYFVLQNTRLHLVMRMADVIAFSIEQAMFRLARISHLPNSIAQSE